MITLKNHSSILVVLLTLLINSCISGEINRDPIRPSKDYPGYWEYKGKPVLLLGGTRNDNLFQESTAPDHLKELASVGGNFIRNTMSARDSGDFQPFLKLETGLYNLDQWNDFYWKRFDTLLSVARDHEIIVQIEIWDRFDFSREPWFANAFNPGLNINYTYGESGLDSIYPEHPGQDLQPFFHSIPGMPQYNPLLDKVRVYQEKYVEKLLEYTFQYPNVLYCMNNETNTPVEWGRHWIGFIRERAKDQGKEVYLTDMFDAFYRPSSCASCVEAISREDIYDFLDISQVNSRNFGKNHWDTIQWIVKEVTNHKRPLNCTKVYGSGFTGWGSGSPHDGVERFCRALVGGVAAARFHRPTSGNGLNEIAQAAIRAVRIVEHRVRFWEVEPAMNLLSGTELNEAYLAAGAQGEYLLYFPVGGKAEIDLREANGNYSLSWISLAPGNKQVDSSVSANNTLTLETPDSSGWFVAIKKQ
jgi:hypothetical protein